MKKAAIAAIAMIFGAVIGGGAAYAYATYEYEKRMVKELDSYKRALDALDMTDEKDESDDTVEPDAKTDISEEPPVKKDPNDYEEIIQNYDREIAIAVEDQPVDYTEYAIKQSKDYIKHAIADPIEDSENDHDPAKPYVITDEEYYDDDEYTKIELFLFDDYLLTDELWDPLEEPERSFRWRILRNSSRTKTKTSCLQNLIHAIASTVSASRMRPGTILLGGIL